MQKSVSLLRWKYSQLQQTVAFFINLVYLPLGSRQLHKTEIFLHEFNKGLHKDKFLRGIDVYEMLIRHVFIITQTIPLMSCSRSSQVQLQSAASLHWDKL